MQNFIKKYIPKVANVTKKQNKLRNIRIISTQLFKDINKQKTIYIEKQLLQEKCESVNVAHIAFLCFLCNRYH